MERKVNCKKFGREEKGLSEAPFSGELGQEIFENVCEEAWKMWKDDMMIKVINEYRLNLSVEEDYTKLIEQMKIFVNLVQGESLEVENEERGKK